MEETKGMINTEVSEATKLDAELKLAKVIVADVSCSARVMVFGKGNFDLSSCEKILSEFAAHHKKGLNWFFDMSFAASVDSEIIKTVLTCINKVRAEGDNAAIICVESGKPFKVLDVLGITKCPDMFYNSVHEGLQSTQ